MRKFLISYRTSTQYGRFFHDREDDTLPTEENIVAMEAKVSDERRDQVLIIGIVEIAVTAPSVAKPPSVLGAEEEGPVELRYAANGKLAMELHRVQRDEEGRIGSAFVLNGAWVLKADHAAGVCWSSTYPDRLIDIGVYTGWTK